MNNKLVITGDISLLEALTIMDELNKKLLIVCDGGLFSGVLSIGDIQRALLNKEDLSTEVRKHLRKKITYAHIGDDLTKVKDQMRKEKIEAMPILDLSGQLIDIIEWEQLFSDDEDIDLEQLDIPVVIMAGGKGTRLSPLTKVIPKPLIPISDKTIIEEIMTRFKKFGCNRYIISVNYMTDIIKGYFRNMNFWNIEFIQEKKPLGTGGSLYLLKDSIDTCFFVTNCDTLIDVNYADLLKYHKTNNNTITIVSAVKSFHIPYGIIETGKNGLVRELKEKPDYLYQINSGVYILEPDVFEYIENEKYLNMTDLIEIIIKSGKRVGAFPVSEKSWIDMGNWDEYLKLVNEYLRNVSK